MQVKFTQTARKHRIAKGRAMFVISNNEPIITTNERAEAEVNWIGNDNRGLELHIIGIVKVDNRSATGEQIILVKHVFPTSLNKKKG